MRDELKLLSVTSVLMLLLALGRMPYGYYILLKIAVCATSILMALRLKIAGANKLALAAWAFAALYNPIVRVPFGKDTWSVINLLTIAAIWLAYRKARIPDAEKS
jgi:hypothetical protein